MTTKFGWCLDGLHDQCFRKSHDHVLWCDCECHADDPPVPRVIEPEVLEETKPRRRRKK